MPVDYYEIGQDDINNMNLFELNAEDNKNILDVLHMTNLNKLNACGKCGINQNGISGLCLTELKAFYMMILFHYLNRLYLVIILKTLFS